MPVASPRKIYLIEGMTVNVDDDPGVIDNLPPGGSTVQTTRPVFAKIKKGIGDFLGLTPLDFDNPIFTGVFGGHGLNNGYTYRKTVGGFKVASYTLIAQDEFQIEELRPNLLGKLTPETNGFKTVSIGFPRGHTVSSFLTWLSARENFGQIEFIRTPAGHKIPTSKTAAQPVT